MSVVEERLICETSIIDSDDLEAKPRMLNLSMGVDQA